ncbi:DUF2085 domain-containing protein [Aggregatilinea lenta]|uniref:DUF2085 domain-containing protein n=1 Tax=Aggregatilinea lenta TaxID=913108 RepID=UPI000E5B73A3|nr:DUF2085 domain-containing protein [Aggregatilinea lenta]
MDATTQPGLRPLTMTRSILRHWLVIFLVVYGMFNALPFVAPMFMKLGWAEAGNAIYTVYSFFCHQMAQRSFFLFGKHVMYRPDQLPITLTGSTGTDTLLLRDFRGSDLLGWKVAWSDRMISLYGGVWLAALVYWGVARLRTIKPLSIWVFGLMLLPIVLDGSTHMISDTTVGLLTGFRYDNAWLAALTGHVLPKSFYGGDALGSFNSSMRLITGLLAAVGTVWFTFPLIDQLARGTVHDIDVKLARIADKQRRRSGQLEDAHEHFHTSHPTRPN